MEPLRLPDRIEAGGATVLRNGHYRLWVIDLTALVGPELAPAATKLRDAGLTAAIRLIIIVTVFGPHCPSPRGQISSPTCVTSVATPKQSEYIPTWVMQVTPLF